MENVNEKIFDFAYGEALKDATNQKAFEGEKIYLRKCDGKNIVRTYIDKLFRGEETEFYSTARQVKEAFNIHIKNNNGKTKDGKEQYFTFGNTQKLINMTAKYMYMATYARDDLKSNFAQCHCPMDFIMVEKVIAVVKDKKYTSVLPEFVGKKGWIGKLKAPWSNIDGDITQYENFQALVSVLAKEKECSPIEYDYFMWGENFNNCNLDRNVEK